MPSVDINEKEIITYYDQCQVDYELVWQLDEALGMHYGFWDDQVPHHQAAIHRMNREVAKAAGIQPGERVLDAGCGVGGSSIFLARLGCQVNGITLSQKQVDTCQKNAQHFGVSDQIQFSRQSYLNTDFADNTFDVVWAIESVCYAWDKKDFTKEAFRILKPGGRLVVADFFSHPVQPGSREAKMMDQWTSTWAIKSYALVDEFHSALTSSGFQHLTDQNITRHVEPSIRRLYISFFPGIITSKVGEWLGARNATQTQNTWSTYYQYKTHRKDLWSYHLFTAQKPTVHGSSHPMDE